MPQPEPSYFAGEGVAGGTEGGGGGEKEGEGLDRTREERGRRGERDV